jgi:hypothetical protein
VPLVLSRPRQRFVWNDPRVGDNRSEPGHRRGPGRTEPETEHLLVQDRGHERRCGSHRNAVRRRCRGSRSRTAHATATNIAANRANRSATTPPARSTVPPRAGRLCRARQHLPCPRRPTSADAAPFARSQLPKARRTGRAASTCRSGQRPTTCVVADPTVHASARADRADRRCPARSLDRLADRATVLTTTGRNHRQRRKRPGEIGSRGLGHGDGTRRPRRVVVGVSAASGSFPSGRSSPPRCGHHAVARLRHGCRRSGKRPTALETCA